MQCRSLFDEALLRSWRVTPLFWSLQFWYSHKVLKFSVEIGCNLVGKLFFLSFADCSDRLLACQQNFFLQLPGLFSHCRADCRCAGIWMGNLKVTLLVRTWGKGMHSRMQQVLRWMIIIMKSVPDLFLCQWHDMIKNTPEEDHLLERMKKKMTRIMDSDGVDHEQCWPFHCCRYSILLNC